MITLAEYNRKKSKEHADDGQYKRNGIECPNCKNELNDCGIDRALSSPPQVTIKCFVCGFVGSRIS